MSVETLTGRAGTPCRPSGAQGTASPTAASPVSRGYHAGIVKWYNQQLAYGYISVAPSVKAKLGLPVEGDLYVHATGISGFPKQLNPDDRVEFEVVEGSRGFRAVNVRVVSHAPTSPIEMKSRRTNAGRAGRAATAIASQREASHPAIHQP